MSTTPNLNLPQMAQNTLQPSVSFNDALQILDVLIQHTPQDVLLATPPTTLDTDIGKSWIVATGGTGVWAGKDNQIAIVTAADLWMFIVPRIGWKAYSLTQAAEYRYNGTAWVAA